MAKDLERVLRYVTLTNCLTIAVVAGLFYVFYLSKPKQDLFEKISTERIFIVDNYKKYMVGPSRDTKDSLAVWQDFDLNKNRKIDLTTITWKNPITATTQPYSSVVFFYKNEDKTPEKIYFDKDSDGRLESEVIFYSQTKKEKWDGGSENIHMDYMGEDGSFFDYDVTVKND